MSYSKNYISLFHTSVNHEASPTCPPLLTQDSCRVSWSAPAQLLSVYLPPVKIAASRTVKYEFFSRDMFFSNSYFMPLILKSEDTQNFLILSL